MSSSSSPLRRLAVGAALPLVLGGAGLVAPASAAPSAPPPVVEVALRATRLADVQDMVQAKGHLFVTGKDEVAVLNLRGKVLKRLKHLPGAAGMVVSPRGDRVYVAVRDAGTVVAVDTRRSKVVKTFRVGGCPTDVAVAGGRLFYATDRCGTVDASIASIDPKKGGRPVPSGATGVPDPVLLVGAGSTLVMSDTAGSASVVTSFRADGSTLTRLASDVEDGIVWDLALSPDGATVYVPHNANKSIRAFPAATLRDATAYGPDNLPRSLAVSPDGRTVAAALADAGPDLLGYRTGSGEAAWTRSTRWVGLGRPEAVMGTLTFSDDGRRVFELLISPYPEAAYYLASTPV